MHSKQATFPYKPMIPSRTSLSNQVDTNLQFHDVRFQNGPSAPETPEQIDEGDTEGGIVALLKLCWPAWPSELIFTAHNHRGNPEDKASGNFYVLLEEYKLPDSMVLPIHPNKAVQCPVCAWDAELPPLCCLLSTWVLMMGANAGHGRGAHSPIKFQGFPYKSTAEITYRAYIETYIYMSIHWNIHIELTYEITYRA